MSEEVNIDSVVSVQFNGGLKDFQVVDSNDVDVNHGRISCLSPVGAALLGKKIGTVFNLTLAGGKVVSIRILKIQ